MRRIELTISSNYCNDWNVWCGCRELLQNCKDAEKEYTAKMDVKYNANKKTLTITNFGTKIPLEALLMGFTTKKHKKDLIGLFGEGLKIGIIALLRNNLKIKLYNGSEIWIPQLEKSSVFSSQTILVFYIEENHTQKDRISIEIKGLKQKDWQETQDKVLWLNKYKEDKFIFTDHGTLLLDERFSGHVFVKGIFIAHMPTIKYGYDFYHIAVDRDRKLVNVFDAQMAMSYIWLYALRQKLDLAGPILDSLLNSSMEDVSDFQYIVHSMLPPEKEALKNEFYKRFGEGAIPVANLAESRQLEHYDINGVIVNNNMLMLFQKLIGNFDENLSKLKMHPKKIYSWSELSEIEKENLNSISEIFHEPDLLNKVNVVDFQDENIMGLYISDESIFLNKKHLADLETTVSIVLHEMAHQDAADDGERKHVRNIEKISAKNLVKLWRENKSNNQNIVLTTHQSVSTPN